MAHVVREDETADGRQRSKSSSYPTHPANDLEPVVHLGPAGSYRGIIQNNGT